MSEHDTELRTTALSLAIESCEKSAPDSVITERAAKFLEFLRAGSTGK